MKLSSVVLAIASLFVAASFPGAISSPVPTAAPFGASSSVAVSSSVMASREYHHGAEIKAKFIDPTLNSACSRPPCGFLVFTIDLAPEYEYCLYHGEYDLTTCFKFAGAVPKNIINYIIAEMIFKLDFFKQQNFAGQVQGFSIWSWFQGFVWVNDGQKGYDVMFGYSASKGYHSTLGTTYR